MAQAIRALELVGLDLVSLKEKIRTKLCSNNRGGYRVRGAAARLSHTGGAHDRVRLGLQYRTNRWGSESTRFHGPNVVICKIR